MFRQDFYSYFLPITATIRKMFASEAIQPSKALFDAAILATRYPTEEIIGLDGENFYFYTNGRNPVAKDSAGSCCRTSLQMGTIWSPDPDSQPKTAKLVEMVERLTKLISEWESVEPLKPDGTLMDEIMDLMEQFSNPISNMERPLFQSKMKHEL
ncbi:hypothetical protein [Sinomicrobium sp. M5D2P9]